MRPLAFILAAACLLAGCASRQSNYWAGVANGVRHEQGR